MHRSLIETSADSPAVHSSSEFVVLQVCGSSETGSIKDGSYEETILSFPGPAVNNDSNSAWIRFTEATELLHCITDQHGDENQLNSQAPLRILANKTRLMAASTYFQSLFSNFREATQEVVTVHWEPSDFYKVMQCIDGETPLVHLNNLTSLLQAGEYFGVDAVAQICELWASDKLGSFVPGSLGAGAAWCEGLGGGGEALGDIAESWGMATRIGLPQLEELLVKILAVDFMEACHLQGFEELPFAMLLRVVDHADLTVPSERALAEALLRWCGAGEETSSGLPSTTPTSVAPHEENEVPKNQPASRWRIMHRVRFRLLPPDFILGPQMRAVPKPFLPPEAAVIFPASAATARASGQPKKPGKAAAKPPPVESETSVRITPYSTVLQLAGCQQLTAAHLFAACAAAVPTCENKTNTAEADLTPLEASQKLSPPRQSTLHSTPTSVSRDTCEPRQGSLAPVGGCFRLLVDRNPGRLSEETGHHEMYTSLTSWSGSQIFARIAGARRHACSQWKTSSEQEQDETSRMRSNLGSQSFVTETPVPNGRAESRLPAEASHGSQSKAPERSRSGESGDQPCVRSSRYQSPAGIRPIPSLVHVDLSECWRLSNADLARWLPSACPNLRILRLRDCLRITESVLSAIAPFCPLLEEVDLSLSLSPSLLLRTSTTSFERTLATSSLSTAAPPPRVPGQATSPTSGRCSEGSSATSSKPMAAPSHALHASETDWDCDASARTTYHGRQQAVLKHLERMSLSGRIELTDVALAGIARLGPSLTAVDLSGCTDLTDAGIAHFVASLGQIASFRAAGTLFGPASAAALAQGNAGRGLQILDLRRCPLGVTPAALGGLLENRPELRELRLGGTSAGDGAVLGGVSGALEGLDLEGSQVSAVAVSELLSRCPKLRSVNLRGCKFLPPSAPPSSPRLAPQPDQLSLAARDRLRTTPPQRAGQSNGAKIASTAAHGATPGSRATEGKWNPNGGRVLHRAAADANPRASSATAGKGPAEDGSRGGSSRVGPGSRRGTETRRGGGGWMDGPDHRSQAPDSSAGVGHPQPPRETLTAEALGVETLHLGALTLKTLKVGWGFGHHSLVALQLSLGRLRSLTIGLGGTITDGGLLLVAEVAPPLEKLSLCFQAVSEEGLIPLVRQCPGLSKLSLRHCFGPFSPALLASLRASRGPHLHTLKLQGRVPWLTDADLASLARGCPALRHLSLWGCRQLTAGGLAALVGSLPGLLHLRLEECGSMLSEGGQVILDTCHALRSLHLRHCQGALLQSFIYDAMDRLPLLRRLAVDLCDSRASGFDTPSDGQRGMLRGPLSCVRLARCKPWQDAFLSGGSRGGEKRVHRDTLVITLTTQSVRSEIVANRV